MKTKRLNIFGHPVRGHVRWLNPSGKNAEGKVTIVVFCSYNRILDRVVLEGWTAQFGVDQNKQIVDQRYRWLVKCNGDLGTGAERFKYTSCTVLDVQYGRIEEAVADWFATVEQPEEPVWGIGLLGEDDLLNTAKELSEQIDGLLETIKDRTDEINRLVEGSTNGNV